MPEYLAPGVYIEETSYRAKSIEGVGTSTAGMLGPTRYGPVGGEPELLTSFADFERIFGGLEPLAFEETTMPNYLSQGVRAFFEEGGKRCYVTRVFKIGSDQDADGDSDFADSQASVDNSGAGSPQYELVRFVARFPGEAGRFRITFSPRLSDNLLVLDPLGGQPAVRRVQPHDTVLLTSRDGNPETGFYDVVKDGDGLAFRDHDDPERTISFAALEPGRDSVKLLTLDVVVERPIVRPKRPGMTYSPTPMVLEGFSLHPMHSHSLLKYFTKRPESRRFQLTVPFSIETELESGSELAPAILGATAVQALISGTNPSNTLKSYTLTGGNDGMLPGAAEYQGEDPGDAVGGGSSPKTGLITFEDIEDISILAAPGYSHQSQPDAEAIQGHLMNHCMRMRYRVAVLDSRNNQLVSDVRAQRGKIDSTHAALYYPWVRISDPVSEEEILLPPSGFIAGIYARNDVERGVHKSPANEVVRLALGFEYLVNKGQQEALNPEGINCLRFFEGRGFRVWGARTISSDPEWKYVNVRRYFAYLERSIERGTQWAVFENNGDLLWAKVRRTIEDFMYNEWKSERLLGIKPEEAFFVRCDRSTMTQNDLDNGRLICLIGVSVLKPAEFVIFRIGQWTADRRS